MKRSVKKIAILFFASLFTQSCGEDFLDKQNPNSIPAESWGFTEEEAFTLVTGAYSPLNKHFLYGRWQQVTDNLRSDEAYAYTPGDGRGDLDVFNTLTSSNQPVLFMWQNFYTGVFRANLALEQITAKALNGPEAGQVQDELGDAHFLRAYYYFWLVLNFQNIPLITKTPVDRNEFYPGQASPESVWQFIIDEFTLAKGLLPDSRPNQQLGRATKGAATACLGRAYLFRYNLYKNADDLIQAKANFDEVVNSGRYTLTGNYFDNFSLEKEFNSESVFEIPFVTYSGNVNYNPDVNNSIQGEIRGQEFAPLKVPGVWASTQPLRRAFDEFTDLTSDGKTDPRRDVTFHYNKPGETLYGRSFQSLYKDNLDYVGWKKYQVSMYPDRYPTERVSNQWPPLNYRELRLADVLLLLAETENELGNTTRAVDLINQVRSRAGVAALDVNAFNQVSLRNQLMHERAVELCGEGKRWYDLMRWGRLAEVLQSIRPGFILGTHEYLPIPSEEISVNTNLKQNNGY
jgi:starch-binding outer membrane protein, SusD/RagB family